MARIAAGLDFGQAVAEPVRSRPLDVGPGLAQVAQAVGRMGAQQEAEGQQLMRQQEIERRQAEREAAAVRERADAGQAQARLYTMRDTLADELERIGQEVQDNRLPKTDAAKAWQERTQKILADNLEGVPEAHRAIVAADVQGLAGRLTSKVGDIVRRRDQADTRASLVQVLEHTQRLAVTEPDKARQIIEDTLPHLGPAAGMAPDEIAKTRQGWLEGAAYTRAFTAVNAAKSDNRALSVVERGIAENADLDPQRKAQLLAQVDNFRSSNEARALRQAQQAELAAQAAQRRSDEAFGILSRRAMNGQITAEGEATALIQRLTPAAAAEYRAMAAEIPARTAVAMLPLDTQAQQLDTLRAQATRAVSKPLEDEIKRREQVLTQARKDYADDPLRAANERGLLPGPLRPLDLSTLDSVAAGLAERAGQAQAVAGITRAPVSPLLADEARRLGDVLNALPIAERGKRIAQIAEIMPAPMLLAMAQQIGGEDKGARRALALEMQLGSEKTTAGRYRSELVARGAQAIRDKGIKEDTSAEFGLRAQIAKEIGEALPPRWRADAVDAARLMYLGLQSGNASPDVAQAVRLAVGGQIVEHNGRRIPLAAGLDEDKLQDVLKAYPAAEVARQAPGGVVMLPGGQRMPVAEFLANLPQAQLEPVAPGRYGVRAGAGIVMNPAGRPIIIEVR